MWFRRKVIKGHGFGRTIGFPTLNFRTGRFGEQYSEGVYACEVRLPGPSATPSAKPPATSSATSPATSSATSPATSSATPQALPAQKGALYFGPRLHHKGKVLEVHLPGFSGRLYGGYVFIRVGEKIRNPIQMKDGKQLKKQIGLDLRQLGF
jgi:FAD synthase